MKSKITILAMMAFLAGSAMADSSIKEVKSTATINKFCKISAPDVVFVNYEPGISDYQYASHEVNVFCTKGTAWSFKSGSTIEQPDKFISYAVIHNKINPKSILKYQVESANSREWADDIMYYLYSGIGIGDNQIVPVRYRLLPNQYIEPGNYVGTKQYDIVF